MLSVFRPFGFQDGSNEIYPSFISFSPLFLSCCLSVSKQHGLDRVYAGTFGQIVKLISGRKTNVKLTIFFGREGGA